MGFWIKRAHGRLGAPRDGIAAWPFQFHASWGWEMDIIFNNFSFF
jgi:hypothetical protein